jgi:hypothetical protein
MVSVESVAPVDYLPHVGDGWLSDLTAESTGESTCGATIIHLRDRSVGE